MAYFIAIVLMFLKVFLMVGIGILNLFSSDFIDGMCVVALAPAVIIMQRFVYVILAQMVVGTTLHQWIQSIHINCYLVGHKSRQNIRWRPILGCMSI
jgi:hypothetical protein